MRRHVLHDPELLRGKLRHHVGRRRLDEVDLTVEQRIGARHCVGDRDQHDAVGLRQPGLVPVGRVLHEIGALARHQLVELERAGARGLHRDLGPVAAELLPLRRAADQEPRQLVGEQRVDALGGDLDGVVVDLLERRDRRDARAHLRALLRVELRRLVVQHLVEVPDHRVGLEVGAVVKFDALAQREAPDLVVLRVDLPLGGQARDQLAGARADVGFPRDHRVVNRVAGELVGTGAAVRLAGRERDVGHRDAVARHGFGVRRGHQAQRQRRGPQPVPPTIREQEHRDNSKGVWVG